MSTQISNLLEEPERFAGNGEARRHIVVLSSSPLLDRILLHTRFLEELTESARISVWATSVSNARFEEAWRSSPARVQAFPAIRPFKEFPYNYLRRLNEFVWDFQYQPVSRLSMWRHVRDRTANPYIRALRLPAQALALMKAEKVLEDRLERMLVGYPRSPEALERFSNDLPDLVLTTGPFQYEQPAIVAEAKNLGIRTVALIPSWDNLSTKPRMVFKYDSYLVWSHQQKQELREYYPQARDVPIYVIGAPQFDVFFQKRFELTRAEFCGLYGLTPELPLVVYAVGSPNFIKGEPYGALDLAKRIAEGQLGDVQLLVRPHPLHDNGEMADLFRNCGPRVVLQKTAEAGTAITSRSQDEGQIAEWVSTFRHADVVVNLFSTVTIDAAIFDRPVVNLDYDPSPGQPDQQLIQEVNHLWTHYKPIAESGGVWLVKTPDELVKAVLGYLRCPELHKEQRRWIVNYVCEYVDGTCGERMARALLSEANCRAGEENSQ